jgi:hypothetical protein
VSQGEGRAPALAYIYLTVMRNLVKLCHIFSLIPYALRFVSNPFQRHFRFFD